MTRMFSALLLTLALGLLGGCPPPAAPPPPPAGGPPPAAAPKYKIAVVPKGTAHVFWKTVQAGAEAAGQEGGARILWNGPSQETDVARQISILENFITQKVDALVMAACDAEALVPIVKKARAAGIPVITIDSGIASDDALSFVATDNVAGAKAAAEKLAELIGGQGKVGLIPFIKGAATSDMREQGFKQGLAQYRERIKLASTLYSQSDASIGMRKTEDMLTAVPDLAGIFAANEPAVVGAAQVLKQRGKAGKVKLVGFDASDAEIAALEEGTVQALIVQNPFKMGHEGVRLAIEAIQGKPVPKRLDTGVVVVTKENMNDPEIQKILYPLGKGNA